MDRVTKCSGALCENDEYIEKLEKENRSLKGENEKFSLAIRKMYLELISTGPALDEMAADLLKKEKEIELLKSDKVVYMSNQTKSDISVKLDHKMTVTRGIVPCNGCGKELFVPRHTPNAVGYWCSDCYKLKES